MERDISIEKLEYQDNKFSYNLALIVFILDQYYLIIVMNNVSIDYHVGIEIFINLMFYMFLFLGMEKVKMHHLNWSRFFVVLGGMFFLRTLYIPRRIMAQANALRELGDELSLNIAQVLEVAAQRANIALIIAGILIIISGLYGMKLSIKLKNYRKQIGSI